MYVHSWATQLITSRLPWVIGGVWDMAMQKSVITHVLLPGNWEMMMRGDSRLGCCLGFHHLISLSWPFTRNHCVAELHCLGCSLGFHHLISLNWPFTRNRCVVVDAADPWFCTSLDAACVTEPFCISVCWRDVVTRPSLLREYGWNGQFFAMDLWIEYRSLRA